MATMGFKLKYGNPNIRYIKEAAGTQTFVAGDLVYLASGAVTVIANDDVIFGVAQEDASGTTGTLLPVSIISPEQTWVAAFDDTTSTDYVGEDYGLNITSDSMSVNLGETTNTAVTIIDLDPRDGAKSLGRVLIQFVPAVLQGYIGSGTSAI